MIIRSFVAESVAGALKDVRSQMGGEAVVLKTRRLSENDEGGRFEVTACLDKPTAGQATTVLTNRRAAGPSPQSPVKTSPKPKAVPRVATGQPSAVSVETPVVNGNTVSESSLEKRLAGIEEKLERLLRADQTTEPPLPAEDNGPIGEAIRAMKAADVPETFVRSFFQNLRESDPKREITDEVIREQLRQHIETIVEPLSAFRAGDRVVFVGPAGAGKTSVVGKLASRLVLEDKQTVTLVMLDASKVGALDEVESYGELLGVDVTDQSTVISGPDDDHRVVLIDTGAMSVDTDKAGSFAEHLNQVRPTVRLAVLSATMRSADIASWARQASAMGVTHLVLTMTDLTPSWGGILAACEAGGLKLAWSTDASSGAGQVVVPDVSSLVAHLLGEEVTRG